MATAEFSKFAGILSTALSQHHLLGLGIAHPLGAVVISLSPSSQLLSVASSSLDLSTVFKERETRTPTGSDGTPQGATESGWGPEDLEVRRV